MPNLEDLVSGKPILDPCCGSRMFWFDQHNPNVLFCDNRKIECQAIWKSTKGDATRYCSVLPDVVADFCALPFDNESFWHIVFDPPHLVRAGDNAWMVKKYGKLPTEWRTYLHDGFAECWRVLRTYGTLVFKWNEVQIPVSDVVRAIGRKPLYGHKSGKRSLTHWMAFVKLPDDKNVCKQGDLFDEQH